MAVRKDVFVVDDEPMVLKAIQRAIHAMKESLPVEVDLHLFERATEALEQIDRVDPSLILSDNSMPDLKGFDFLLLVREKYPDIRTVMISGGAFEAPVLEAAKKGKIDRLIEKPWQSNELVKCVSELLE